MSFLTKVPVGSENGNTHFLAPSQPENSPCIIEQTEVPQEIVTNPTPEDNTVTTRARSYAVGR